MVKTEGSLRGLTGQLILDLDDQLHLLENQRQQLQQSDYHMVCESPCGTQESSECCDAHSCNVDHKRFCRYTYAVWEPDGVALPPH